MKKEFTPKLSPRLEGIVGLVPNGSRVSDVGCDHGYISIALLQRGIATHSIASDIKKGPLEAAVKNIGKAGLSDKIETRLAPGISALNEGEADVIIIAGMGQRTIADILTEKPEIAKSASYLILQPQSELSQMRRFLDDNGYKIVKNRLMREDDKYYFAMVASAVNDRFPGEQENVSEIFKKHLMAANATPEMAEMYENINLLFGWDLIYTDPQMAYYLNFVEHEWSEALEMLGKAKKPDYDRITQLTKEVEAARFALEINTTLCASNKQFKEMFDSTE